MRSGQTLNSGMDFNGNWTFDQWGTASSPSYQASGGNPDGFIEMTLFGTGDRGYFWQAFNVSGSRPYTGALRLDVRTAGALTSGRLLISVDSSPILDPTTAVAIVPYSGPTGWTSTGRVSVDPKIVAPGQYYLKVGFWVDGATGAVDVGLDNVRLTWTTDAGVVLYVPAPLPLVVFVSQDKTVFLSYYALIAAAIFLFGGFYAVRDRRETLRVLKAPIEAIGTRLRSRSAWIAIGQVWMAVTFFQVAVIFVLGLIGFEPTTPINITQDNAWVFLFDLANAGVYEEIVFRLLLIGLPMAIGSAIVRIIEVSRSSGGNGTGSAGRYIAGAWRYLFGGVLRRESSKEAHVAAWAFLVASSAIFGLAHAPGREQTPVRGAVRPGVRLPVPPTWSGRRDPRPLRQRLRTLPFLRRNRRRGARGRPHPAVRGPCNRRRRIPRLVCDRRLASPVDAVGQVPTPDARRGPATSDAVRGAEPVAIPGPANPESGSSRGRLVAHAARRLARHRSPGAWKDPAGLHALVRTASLRLPARPVPMPLLRMGRGSL